MTNPVQKKKGLADNISQQIHIYKLITVFTANLPKLE